MPDAEVQILIKATDEATATLKKIEGQLVSSGKNIQQTEKNTANAFTKTQGALLQLGHVAQSVHNIWETYENSQRLVENAQDRVENATIRLKNAQDNLRNSTQKLIDIEEKHARDELTLERANINLEKAHDRLTEATKQYGKYSLEAQEAALDFKEAQLDLADAEKLSIKKTKELKDAEAELQRKSEDVTISQNQLEIAQRKLKKATDDAKWAYVDMGVQMVAITAQIPTMLKSLGDLGISLGGIAGGARGASTALGAEGVAGALGGIGLVGGGAVAVLGGLFALEWYKATEDMAKYAQEVEHLGNNYVEFQEKVPALFGTKQLQPVLSEEVKNFSIDWNQILPTEEQQNKLEWLSERAFSDMSTNMTINLNDMQTNSKVTIDEINKELNSLNRTVTTIHKIKTVYV